MIAITIINKMSTPEAEGRGRPARRAGNETLCRRRARAPCPLKISRRLRRRTSLPSRQVIGEESYGLPRQVDRAGPVLVAVWPSLGIWTPITVTSNYKSH